MDSTRRPRSLQVEYLALGRRWAGPRVAGDDLVLQRLAYPLAQLGAVRVVVDGDGVLRGGTHDLVLLPRDRQRAGDLAGEGAAVGDFPGHQGLLATTTGVSYSH